MGPRGGFACSNRSMSSACARVSRCRRDRSAGAPASRGDLERYNAVTERDGLALEVDNKANVLLPGIRGNWLQNSVHEAVGERFRLLLEVGLQIRRVHLHTPYAILWLAVLHVTEPGQHRLDLSPGRHEVRLVGGPPAVRLTELPLLLEVSRLDAIDAEQEREDESAESAESAESV